MTRHWLVLVAATVVLGAGLYAAEAARDPVFETAALLEFGDVEQRTLDPGEPAPGHPARHLSNRTGHLRSQAVLERASQRLDGISPRSVRDAIEIVADPDRGDTISVVARGASAVQAAAIANAVAEAYQEVASGRERSRIEEAIVQLDQTIGRLQTRLDELDAQPAVAQQASSVLLQQRSLAGQFVELATRRERLATAAALADAGVTAFDPAPEGSQTGPNPKRLGALGALLGLAFASAYAYWREGHMRAVRTPQEAKVALGVPLLAILPRPADRPWRWSPIWLHLVAVRSEPYQFLGIAVDRALSWLPAANILVVGVRPHRGNPAVALNAAIALCQDHRRVLLVDGDLRDRKLTGAWQLDGKLGLADLNDPTVSVGQTTVVAGMGKASSWAFMPAGRRPRDPFASIRGPAVRRVLEEFEADRPGEDSLRVVVNAPAVLEAADAGAIAPLVDGVVLIVHRGDNLDDVIGGRDLIDVAGGRVIGFVFVAGRRPARRKVSAREPHRPVDARPVPVP